MRSIIAAAAALAVASQAFLLPPEVSQSDIQIVDAANLVDTGRVVELPCPDCPVQVMNHRGKVRVKTDKPNHLSLNFKVEHHEDADRLVVNGFELYPHSDPLHSALTAPQTIDRHARKKHNPNWEALEAKQKDHKKHRDHRKHKDHKGPWSHEVLSPELGFSLKTMESKDASGKSQFSTVILDLQILSVGNQFVNDIPHVRAMLVKDAQGRLVIEDVDIAIRNATPSLFVAQKGCDTPLCAWLAFIKGKMGRPLGSCAKNKNGGDGAPLHPELVKAHPLPTHHKTRPHFARPQRTWAHLVRNVAAHILLPVLIGIVAGVSASL